MPALGSAQHETGARWSGVAWGRASGVAGGTAVPYAAPRIDKLVLSAIKIGCPRGQSLTTGV